MLKKIFLTLHRDFDLRVTDFVLAKADFFLSADRDALLNTAAVATWNFAQFQTAQGRPKMPTHFRLALYLQRVHVLVMYVSS